jgi:transcriptional antiterminator RfaH
VGSLAGPAVYCGSRAGRRWAGPRWYCAWTHPHDEHRALHSIAGAGFEAYLPLHLDRDAYRRTRIGPLFPRYVFVRLDAERDPWGRILHCRGVGGLIRHEPDRPTPLPDAAILELLARTSARGVVDDPGDNAPQDAPYRRKSVWQDMTALDAAARTRLLVRLFGEGVRIDQAA